MALGSLVDAGADGQELQKMLQQLPLSGWRLQFDPVMRAGIAGTRALVRVDESDGLTRSFSDIEAILRQAELPQRVFERSLGVFRALAGVEAAIHHQTTSEVHFHEVGGHDALIDVVGVASALELLEIDEVQASAVALGQGMVKSRHGLLPNPAPAVLALLKGAPVYGRELAIELTTPTGAAILAAMATRYGSIPAMQISSTGYGAGAHEIDGLPNLTQVVLGGLDQHVRPSSAPSPAGQPLVLLEANLDDVTGEQLADALAALLTAGAADAWITPVLMKKGRPGQVLSVLCDVSRLDELRQLLLLESGSFGVRTSVVDRYASARAFAEVVVQGMTVRIKTSQGRSKVEHDDALALAKALGLTVREAQSLAQAAFSDQQRSSQQR